VIDTNELSAYALALSRIKGIGPKSVSQITEKFPTCDLLESASTEDLSHELGEKLSQMLIAQLRYGWREKLSAARDSIARHRDADITVLAINDVAYPYLLKRIADPPVLLYLKGSLSAIASLEAVAVIGTRTPTPAGIRVAERVSGVLSKAGYTIVSGLAKGIDAYAHRGCLDANGTTIAVLANPLDARSIYPAENRPLAEEIIDRQGALISEMPLGQMAHRSSFVLRDRIQSGLSLAVFPIQTDVEGGTMHTVRYAERDNRLVFCPVPVEEDSRDRAWAGIHMLLRTNRAQSFDKTSYEEVVSRLQTYQAVLTADDTIPRLDVATVNKLPASSGLLFEEEGAKADLDKDTQMPDAKTVDTLVPISGKLFEEESEKAEEHTFDDASWLAKVEEVCREMQISKEKYNELVGELRKRLFKRRVAKKGSRVGTQKSSVGSQGKAD
jgi:DNA processing protein